MGRIYDVPTPYQWYPGHLRVSRASLEASFVPVAFFCFLMFHVYDVEAGKKSMMMGNGGRSREGGWDAVVQG